MPQNRLAAVGAFVVGGMLLFAVGLFFIGDRRMLFDETIEIYAEFDQVAALANGATVRVAGMDAGEVQEIRVPSGPAGRFRVRMRVRKDLHPLIRVDSIASIQNDGLVGNKFVQIQTGSDASPQVQEGGTIQSREPFDLADVMQMMSDTIVTVNAMLVDVKGRLDEALVAISSAATDAQVLMNAIGGELQTMLTATRQVTADVQVIVSNVRQGRGTVGKLVNDDALYTSVKSIAADAEQAMAVVRQASVEARQAIADLRGQGGPMRGLTTDLQRTLDAARDAMSDLAETTEALKRSFLFRGFFNRRGYFDLDDIGVAEYRAGALESGDRRVLRIWLGADRLFERDADGALRLTPDGMARVDSAMATFVGYPPNTPFVVEGYARGLTADERYLSSRARAQLVRDYVVRKFQLDQNYVAIMPLGVEAPGSPAGGEWDGVALALFVSSAKL